MKEQLAAAALAGAVMLVSAGARTEGSSSAAEVPTWSPVPPVLGAEPAPEELGLEPVLELVESPAPSIDPGEECSAIVELITDPRDPRFEDALTLVEPGEAIVQVEIWDITPCPSGEVVP